MPTLSDMPGLPPRNPGILGMRKSLPVSSSNNGLRKLPQARGWLPPRLPRTHSKILSMGGHIHDNAGMLTYMRDSDTGEIGRVGMVDESGRYHVRLSDGIHRMTLQLPEVAVLGKYDRSKLTQEKKMQIALEKVAAMRRHRHLDDPLLGGVLKGNQQPTTWDKDPRNGYQRHEQDLAKTSVRDLDRWFANALTLGTISQNEHGVNTLRNANNFGDYASGTLDILGPAMLLSGPFGNAYRTLYGTYHLANEEGLPKTYREFVAGNYRNAAKSLAGDAINAMIATHGGMGSYEKALYAMGNYGKGAARNYAKASLLSKALKGDVKDTRLGIG